MRRGLAISVLAACALAACSLLTSLDDLRDGGDGGDGGGAVCEGGRTSCAKLCVDLGTDGHNCGACGHDCLGGGCSGGACQPITLASGQASPFGIAVDSQRVYWANNDYKTTFASCPIAGCPASGPDVLLDKQDLPADVFVLGSMLFMTRYHAAPDGGTDAAVMMCDPSNCAGSLKTLAVMPPSNPVAVVANSTAVYWANDTLGTIDTCPVPNCTTPTTFAQDKPGGPWYGLAIDGQAVYWTSHPSNNTGGVYSCSVGGCATPTAIATGGDPFDLAIDSQYVFWTSSATGEVLRCPLGGCGANQPTVIAANQSQPTGVAVDSSGVYWLNSAAVLRCDVSGCGTQGPTILATGQGGPWEIVLDANSIYWTNAGDGRVMRLAK